MGLSKPPVPQVLAEMFDLLTRYADHDLSLGRVDPHKIRRSARLSAAC